MIAVMLCGLPYLAPVAAVVLAMFVAGVRYEENNR